ncbi:dTDP-glucose 4,6-dehydratase [subsurface metagenome]
MLLTPYTDEEEPKIIFSTFFSRQSSSRMVVPVIFTSVYGVNSKVPFSEDNNVTQTISPYAATKLAGEAICHTYHHLYGISIVSLRFFTVYGPWQRPEMAIHKFMRLIHEGAELPMFGDGSSQRDYTYVADIVDGIVSSMQFQCGYEVFNLGNSRTIKLIELINLIENAIGKKANIKELSDQPGDVPITYADISKAGKLLGYAPNYLLERGLKNMAEWFLKNNDSTTSGKL